MIKYVCDDCEKYKFNSDELKWYEKNGEEPIFCKKCEKEREKNYEYRLHN